MYDKWEGGGREQGSGGKKKKTYVDGLLAALEGPDGARRVGLAFDERGRREGEGGEREDGGEGELHCRECIGRLRASEGL